MTEKEFDDNLLKTLDTVVEAMVESPEINPDKFYSMVCILENLRFFSPVIYSALRKKE